MDVLTYSIMGKAADSADVQQKLSDTHHKNAKMAF